MAHGRASFLVTDPLVQNDPNQSTKPMRDCSDGLPVSKARYQPAIHDLEDASFAGVSSDSENGLRQGKAFQQLTAIVKWMGAKTVVEEFLRRTESTPGAVPRCKIAKDDARNSVES
jgi:hypothetical protein